MNFMQTKPLKLAGGLNLKNSNNKNLNIKTSIKPVMRLTDLQKQKA